MSANPLSSIPPIGPTTGMVPSPASGRFRPIDPLRVLRQYAVLLVIAGVVGVVLGVGIYVTMLKLSPVYSSQIGFQVNSQGGNAWGVSDSQSTGNTDSVQRAISDQIQQLKSDNVIDLLVHDNKVQATKFFQKIKAKAGNSGDPFQMAHDALQNQMISASPVQNSSIFNVTVDAHQKHSAEVIATELKEVYHRTLQLQANQSGSQLLAAFSDAETTAQGNVNRLKDKLQAFTLQHQISGSQLQSASSAASIEYQSYARQQSQLKLQLDQAETQYAALKQQMQSGNVQPSAQARAYAESSPGVQNLGQQIWQMKQQRQAMLERFGPNHPSVRQLDRQITTAEQQRKDKIQELLQQQEAVQLTQAQSAVEGIKEQLTKLQPSLKASAARMADLTNEWNQFDQIQSDLKDAQDHVQTANQALMNAQMAQSRPDYLPATAVYGPTTPKRTSPKATVVIPGVTVLVLGLVGGLVFLKELLDQRVKSPADVSMLASGELLGIIPDAAEDPSGSSSVERVVELQPTGLLSESFRQVRTAVLSKMDRRGYKTVVIVGAQPECGASALASNLAASMAYNGRRVLLIDANFRRPNQHTLRDLPNQCGLLEVLNGEATASSVIVDIEGVTMSVMPAGKSRNAQPELLESQSFRSLLGELERQFDLIIIDAPPALLTSEARLLAKQVDSLVLVARAGRDKRGMIDRMSRQLDGQRADILGVILNGVRSSAGGYFRKNYQDFYRYQQGSSSSGNGRTTSPVPASEAAESRV